MIWKSVTISMKGRMMLNITTGPIFLKFSNRLTLGIWFSLSISWFCQMSMNEFFLCLTMKIFIDKDLIMYLNLEFHRQIIRLSQKNTKKYNEPKQDLGPRHACIIKVVQLLSCYVRWWLRFQIMLEKVEKPVQFYILCTILSISSIKQ